MDVTHVLARVSLCNSLC